jgi:uncharacterized membrane protein (UPF0127 family)
MRDRYVLVALVCFAVAVGLILCKGGVGGGIERFQENAISNGGEAKLEFVDPVKGLVKATAFVEVARTPTEIERGLMHRLSLPADGGMLFMFDPPSEKSFWMRNTHIPLDMVFVGPDERVLNIRKSVKPLSEESQPSGGAVQYVVELPGGTADRKGIAVGDLMRIA